MTKNKYKKISPGRAGGYFEPSFDKKLNENPESATILRLTLISEIAEKNYNLVKTASWAMDGWAYSIGLLVFRQGKYNIPPNIALAFLSLALMVPRPFLSYPGRGLFF